MKEAIFVGASVAVLLSALTTSASAQSQPAAPPPVPQDLATVLDDLIVEASKRPQLLSEVPLAVTAYGAEQIEDAQVRDIRDLQILSPQLVVNASSGSTQTIFTIRGNGTPGQNTGLEQSVGVFIDGVYRGRPGSATGDYSDISQIEVLRGPQGTLFGRNTSGGVVSIRTEPPSFSPSAKIDSSFGTYDFRQIRGTVTGPLIADTLAFRLTGSWQTRDGYVEDVNTDETYNDRDRWTVRGQLLWDISPVATLRLIADYSETDEICCAAVPIFYGPAGAAIGAVGGTLLPSTPGMAGPFAGGLVTSDYDVALNRDTQPINDASTDQGISAQLDWGFGFGDFTAIAATRRYETLPYAEGDFTDLDLIAQTAGQDITENSLEVRLASPDDDRRVDWLVGLFLFDQSIFADQDIFYGADLRAYVEAITPRVPVAPGVTVPAVRRLEQLTGRPLGTFFAPGLAVDDDYDYTARSAAVFGQASWHLTEQLSLTGGLRYSREEKDADYDIRSFDAFAQIPLVGPLAGFAALQPLQQFPAVAPFSASIEDDDVSGTLSVAWEPEVGVNFYARYSRGYKSGGFNLSRTAPQTRPGNPTPNLDAVIFEPETVDSYEVGGKFRFWEGRAELNANLFYQTLDNYQTNAFNGVAFNIINAGGLQGSGLEWDYRVRLTDDLTLNGGGTLQDIEYTDFPNASPTAAQVLAGRTSQSLSGETPNFVSELLISGGLTWQRPISAGLGIRANLNYLYRTEYTTAQDLDPLSVQDAYVLVNASLGLGTLDERWGIEVWARNLTDERIYNIVFDTPFQTGNQSAFVEPPRTLGVTVRRSF